MTTDINSFDSIVVGAGFAGAVAARELAERGGEKVLVLESRDHIGGNCYDEPDKYGILVHVYGPHIFHTNSERAYKYLSRFTEWIDYSHEVVAKVGDEEIPVPFNLNTLRQVFPKDAEELEALLIETFGEGARVPILKLREAEDERLQKIADYVYRNIFLKYTMKQWGKKPEEIDPSVSGRVPVVISHDNRYFQDKWQGMPKEGFTKLFERLLDHEGITVKTGVDAGSFIKIENDRILVCDDVPDECDRDKASASKAGEKKKFTGKVIYTGLLDELFDCRYGRLPYRSLRFDVECRDEDRFQSHGVVNYTVSEDFTRISEFKHLTGQLDLHGTTIMREYPFAYSGAEGEVPYYAINNPENDALYARYKELADQVGLIPLGRLAEYKYYNIDAIVDHALDVMDGLIEG
ncbi:MAG: UDP-galactopyranose mutase [Eubacterium sp.]|nr:UDP-galactopyranose mutase [Eubacterium sp.]